VPYGGIWRGIRCAIPGASTALFPSALSCSLLLIPIYKHLNRISSPEIYSALLRCTLSISHYTPPSFSCTNVVAIMAAAVLSSQSAFRAEIMDPSNVSQNERTRHGRGKHGGSVGKGGRARAVSNVDERENVICKALSWILKRAPQNEELELDEEGFADCGELVSSESFSFCCCLSSGAASGSYRSCHIIVQLHHVSLMHGTLTLH